MSKTIENTKTGSEKVSEKMQLYHKITDSWRDLQISLSGTPNENCVQEIYQSFIENNEVSATNMVKLYELSNGRMPDAHKREIGQFYNSLDKYQSL